MHRPFCLPPLFAVQSSIPRSAAPENLTSVEHLRRLVERQSRNPQHAASVLIARYGSFAAVLAAPVDQLNRCLPDDPGAVDEVRSFAGTMMYALREEAYRRPLLSHWQAVLDYLSATMVHEAVEVMRVLFLDSAYGLIVDEIMWRGSIDQCQVHVREVFARALEVGAASIILAHNHPGGDATPSRSDVAITKAMRAAGDQLGIALLDHIIVARNAHASLRSMGLA